MKEANLWKRLRKEMRTHWAVQRLELGSMGMGTPDLLYATNVVGLIELKRIDNWPKRKTTKVRCNHFTMVQKAFIRKWGRRAGYVFLFAQIDKEYFLFDHVNALGFGNMTQDELREAAIYSENHIDAAQISELISKPH